MVMVIRRESPTCATRFACILRAPRLYVFAFPICAHLVEARNHPCASEFQIKTLQSTYYVCENEV